MGRQRPTQANNRRHRTFLNVVASELLSTLDKSPTASTVDYTQVAV